MTIDLSDAIDALRGPDDAALAGYLVAAAVEVAREAGVELETVLEQVRVTWERRMDS